MIDGEGEGGNDLLSGCVVWKGLYLCVGGWEHRRRFVGEGLYVCVYVCMSLVGYGGRARCRKIIVRAVRSIPDMLDFVSEAGYRGGLFVERRARFWAMGDCDVGGR